MPPRAFLRIKVEAAIEIVLDTLHRHIAHLNPCTADAELEPEEPETGICPECGVGAHRFDVGTAA